jgi:hypothetical protein
LPDLTSVQVVIDLAAKEAGVPCQQTGAARVHFSAGGSVGGSGDGDTVPAMLTPGEEVIRRGPAEKNRALLKWINEFGDRVDIGGDQSGLVMGFNKTLKFAGGGTVPDLGTDNWLAPYYAQAVQNAHLAHLAHEAHMLQLAQEHARQVASEKHLFHTRHVAHERHVAHTHASPAGHHHSTAHRTAGRRFPVDGITLGQIPDADWDRLMRMGWHGIAGDGAERIYPRTPAAASTGGRSPHAAGRI